MLYAIPFTVLLLIAVYGVPAALAAGIIHIAIVCGMLAVLPGIALVCMVIEK